MKEVEECDHVEWDEGCQSCIYDQYLDMQVGYLIEQSKGLV